MALTRYRSLSPLVVTCLVISGCGPAWHFDYDEAVRQARRSDRDILILYKDPLDVDSGKMRDILEAPEIASRNADKVWCAVVPFYAPNRKFVAQFGITEAPAIIVLHPDQTYHALSGVRTPEAVARFLDAARAPGKKPNLDFQVPVKNRIEYYNVYEHAVEKARRQNRRLCVVYKWWLDGKSTELINRISRPHVWRYFADSVNCILDWDHQPNRAHVARFGVHEYPAIIIVEPDGKYRVLRGLRTDDEIIRFALGRRVDRHQTIRP